MATPDYAGPQIGRRLATNDAAFRTAVWCGAVPLVLGTSATAAFVVTGSNYFIGLGLMVLVGGLASVFAGTLQLFDFSRGVKPETPEALKRRRFRIKGAAILLVANFPAALACAVVRVREAFVARVELTVQNFSNSTVPSVQFDTPAGDIVVKGMVPGMTSKRSFKTYRGGTLAYSVLHEGRNWDAGVVTGDADAFRGMQYTLTIRDGAVDGR